MRYYTIIISDPISKKEIRKYTSLDAQGRTNLGALNIEIDVPVFQLSAADGAGYIKIWGVSLQDVGGASDLNGMLVQLYAGMAKGLPLAKPAQAGLILTGIVQQAFGNWLGVNQSIDLIVQADGISASTPKNIVLDWKKGTQLSTAIANTLSTAFPTYTQTIDISPNLVLNADEPGYYASLSQFAQYIKEVSQKIIGSSTYNGVAMTIKESAFFVYDGTSQTTPKQIDFNDLIGQPTWIDAGTIQFHAVLRSDLGVGDYVKLPKGQITTTQQSLSQFRQGSVFQGIYQIGKVRHVGNFRQPDAASWVTVVDIYKSA